MKEQFIIQFVASYMATAVHEMHQNGCTLKEIEGSMQVLHTQALKFAAIAVSYIS